jgi:hypothetical protein
MPQVRRPPPRARSPRSRPWRTQRFGEGLFLSSPDISLYEGSC